MRKFFIVAIIVLLVFFAVAGLVGVARGQGPGTPDKPEVFGREIQGENLREVTNSGQGDAPQAPDISFIDSPSSVCYQPDPAEDTCYINWYYMSVSASPNYMVAMTVTLNSIGTVARIGGFFQTSMYVPYNMLGNGFRVPCGPLGAGGSPTLGNAYSWTINARDSSNLKSANYGTAYCPAYTP